MFTPEQQARLNVDEQGHKKNLIGGQQTIGPAWTRGEIERPQVSARTHPLKTFVIPLFICLMSDSRCVLLLTFTG